jgi:hypothetical protein
VNNVARNWDPLGGDYMQPLADQRLTIEIDGNSKTKCKNPRAPDSFVAAVRQPANKMHCRSTPPLNPEPRFRPIFPIFQIFRNQPRTCVPNQMS